ncbi:MAG: hypothetical protein ACM30G_10445 [Micromonosporaceae bacterium]
MSEPEPDQPAVIKRPRAAQPGSGRPRSGRRGSLGPLLAFVIASVVLALAAGGVYRYRQRTAPDQGTPITSVHYFLTAVLVDHDTDAAGRVVCKGWTGEAGMTAMEGAVDPDVVRVTWDTPAVVRESDAGVQIQVRLRFRYPDDVTPSGEHYWIFDVADQGGWRVCGARPLPGPVATP